jgi:diguanylate cyclase (GGDEF)-like protein
MPNAIPCPVPENEAQRVQAVRDYDVLDTPPELEFDALTRVASHTFQAPIAVVGLMDTGRLWFKSKLGLDIPQLDRQIAFCSHAIMRPREPMVVPDLLSDQRFAENPLVAQPPNVRFYAGAPIVDPSGLALGTIAVIDAQPRVFTTAQRETLGDLASLVITALDARRRAMELKRLALTDYLTGIPNRAQLDLTLETEVATARRTGVACAVIAMDLDGFKDVNDRHGHAVGDELLVAVAGRLSAQLRKGDMLGRLGGDEFVIVLRDGDEAAAQALIRRIGAAINEPCRLASGVTVQVGISAGYARFEPAISSGAELLALADKALYAAKGRLSDRRH